MGGLVIAYAQGFHNPELVLFGLAYSGALVVLGIPILAPFFPVTLKRAPNDYIQKLQTPLK